MDVLNLLARAGAAGLRMETKGEKLLIRGPVSAEAIVQQVMARKAEVMAAFAAVGPPANYCPLDSPKLPERPDAAGEVEDAMKNPGGRQARSVPQGQPADQANPRLKAGESEIFKITVRGEGLEVTQIHGMWFFRRTVEAGWTNACPELARMIEEAVGNQRFPACPTTNDPTV